MKENLRRTLQRMQRRKDEELADFRQYYYSMSSHERQEFRQQIRALVESAKPFGRSPITVQLGYQMTSYCRQVDSIITKAVQTPQEILAALDGWDAAKEQNPSFVF